MKRWKDDGTGTRKADAVQKVGGKTPAWKEENKQGGSGWIPGSRNQQKDRKGKE
jgi:hypothetical protein